MTEEIRQYLSSYLVSLGCDINTAEDVVQETFLAVHQRPPNIICNAYYKRIAYHKYIDMQRRKNKSVNMALNWWHDIPDKDEVNSDDPRIPLLMDSLEWLSPVQKEAIEDHFFHNLSREEAAAKAGISVHGWKNRFERAKRNLRQFHRTS